MFPLPCYARRSKGLGLIVGGINCQGIKLMPSFISPVDNRHSMSVIHRVVESRFFVILFLCVPLEVLARKNLILNFFCSAITGII